MTFNLIAFCVTCTCIYAEPQVAPFQVGPQQEFSEHSGNETVPLVVLYGAIGRHNFGDILMGEMLHQLIKSHCASYQDRNFVYADVVGQDMRIYGGHQVVSIESIAFHAASSVVDVIAVGGEILNCKYGQAKRMLYSTNWPEASKELVEKRLMQMSGRNQMIHNLIAKSPAVYIPQRQWFVKPGAIIVNAAGGYGRNLPKQNKMLRDADFVSFRDDPRRFHGKLTYLSPDSVTVLPWIFGKRVLELARTNGLLTKRYIAVQFAERKLDKQFQLTGNFGHKTNVLAQSLAKVAAAHDLDIVLFRAGAATGHDKLEDYATLASQISACNPEVTVQLYEDLNVWSIVSIIAAADLVMSTSLHVRINAFSWGVPRMPLMSIAKRQEKYATFVRLFDNGLPHKSSNDAVQAQERLLSTYIPLQVQTRRPSSKKSFSSSVKRAKNAYMFFFGDKLAEVRAALLTESEDGKVPLSEVAKKVGAMWKALDDVAKTPYTDLAAAAKAERDIKIAELMEAASLVSEENVEASVEEAASATFTNNLNTNITQKVEAFAKGVGILLTPEWVAAFRDRRRPKEVAMQFVNERLARFAKLLSLGASCRYSGIIDWEKDDYGAQVSLAKKY